VARQLIIKDRDKGWNRAKRYIRDRKAQYVDVGVMTVHDLRSDDVTNTMLAMVHEFGLGVPERSFIRSTVDEKQLEYIKFMHKLGGLVAVGKMTKKQALTLLGAKVEADMKTNIRSGIEPALAASTVASKGSSKPLINTGQLASSIDYEVGPL
jgi:hypothetical protein